MTAPQPLARVRDIEKRVSETLDEAEDIALAESFLDIVSAQVRFYGSPWPDPILAPAIAIAVTIEAASRGFLNPAGYNLERANQLTLQRSDPFAAGGMLTREEIAMVKSAAGNTGFFSVLIERDVKPSGGANSTSHSFSPIGLPEPFVSYS